MKREMLTSWQRRRDFACNSLFLFGVLCFLARKVDEYIKCHFWHRISSVITLRSPINCVLGLFVFNHLAHVQKLKAIWRSRARSAQPTQIRHDTLKYDNFFNAQKKTR